MRYRDRGEGGRRLAAELSAAGFGPSDSALVLGIARGGVPVAAEIAVALEGELDVAVARKLGAPGNPEFAVGAVASGGEPILNERIIEAYGITPEYLAGALARERAEIERRTAAYRAGRPAPEVEGRTVIVVDDGVATGSTLTAVLRSVRASRPGHLVCAIPVGPPDVVRLLADDADDVICPMQPSSFMAVGGWYEDFGQLSDAEVVGLLNPA